MTPKKDAPSTSKTSTMDRAKNDTAAIAQEVREVADQAVLEDMYGHGMSFSASLLGSMYVSATLCVSCAAMCRRMPPRV